MTDPLPLLRFAVSILTLRNCLLALLVASQSSAQDAKQLAQLKAELLGATASELAEHDPQLGLLLALEAADCTQGAGTARVPRAEQALRDVLALMPGPLVGEAEGAMNLSPDGSLMVLPGTPLELVEIGESVVRRKLSGLDGVFRNSWIPEGDRCVITCTGDGVLQHWPREGPMVPRPPFGAHDFSRGWLEVSQSGRLVVSIDGTALQVWNVAGELPVEVVTERLAPADAVSVFIPPSEHWIGIGWADGRFRRLPLGATTEIGEVEWHLETAPDPEWDLAPGGRWLRFRSRDRTSGLVEIDLPLQPAPILLHCGSFGSLEPLEFDDQGRHLAAVSSDGDLLLLDTRSSAFVESAHRLGTDWPHSTIRPVHHSWRYNPRTSQITEPWALWRPGHISFSPDGRWLTGTSQDDKRWLWSTVSRKRAQMGERDEVAPEEYAFGPDSRSLVTLDPGLGIIRISHLDPHHPIPRPRPTHKYKSEEGLTEKSFSADGRWLITASGAGPVQAWPLGADYFRMGQSHPWTLLSAGRSHGVASVERNARHQIECIFQDRLATSTTRGARTEVRIWNLKALRAGCEPAQCDVANGYGLYPAEGGYFYSVNKGQQRLVRFDEERRLIEHVAVGTKLESMDFQVVGSRLFAWDQARNIECLRLTGDADVVPLRLPKTKWGLEILQLSSDGRWIIAHAKGDQNARLWHVPDDSNEVTSVDLPTLENGLPPGTATAFDDKSNRFACVTPDGRLFVWQLGPGLLSLSPSASNAEAVLSDADVHELNWIGDILLLLDTEGDAAAWTLNLAETSPNMTRLKPDPTSTSFVRSADGVWLIQTQGKKPRVWCLDQTRAQPSFTLEALDLASNSWFISCSGDGRWLVAPHNGTWTLTHINQDSRKSRRTRLVPQSESVHLTSIDSSNSRIVTWDQSAPGSALVWQLDPTTGTASSKRLPIAGELRGAVFSEDGRYLAVLSESQVFLWDLATDNVARPSVVLPTKGVATLISCVDGKLATWGNGRLQVWTLSYDDLVALGRQSVERQLTERERQLYLAGH